MTVTRETPGLAVSLVLLMGPWAGWSAAQEQPAQDQARDVLDAAGVSGGLIVHLGCGNGRLTAALGRSGRFVVRGLQRDRQALAEARRHISAEGLYGRTSVGLWDGRDLPFGDNLVNLIVSEKPLEIGEKEVMRALAPRGVLLVRKADRWDKQVKPCPEDIDEWTHFLHGPDNNAVARDRVVGPPRRLQWIADPIHLRSHEHLNSVSALVSARGRIFYVIDEGSTAAVAAPPKWRLVARDAFNGILLWKREIGPWEGHFRLFRSGPPAIARRLVADGDRAYATLGYGKRVAAFDAATGQTVRTYDATEGALEIVCDKGRLFVVVGTIDATAPSDPSRPFAATPPPRRKGIVAVDAASGRLMWKRMDKDTAALMPTTLAVSQGRLFFQNTRQVLCLDAASGRETWRADRPVHTTRLSWSAPTLVVSDGVVLSADGSAGGMSGEAARGADDVEWVMSDRDIRKHPVGDLVALDAQTGKQLWTGQSLQGFCNPGDLFVIGNLVWAGANVATRQAALETAVDLRTGQVTKRRPDNGLPVGGHTRCFRDKATERFLVLGGVGVEFVDVKDWSWNANHWVRGTCQYGVMPCNGLLYAPPDSCACRPEARLHGFTAMAPSSAKASQDGPVASQLEKGPAYAAIQDARNTPPNPDSGAWPTYRSDGARSGRTRSSLPARLQQAWRTVIGGKLTSLTVDAGMVFGSRADAHTVFALDAASGRIAWSRMVGGPVDSPPTIHRGLAMFGCRDGWVYCLRASDGELAWRFRAAPQERFLTAMEGVESVWPVHGSVLVRDGLVWFVAGRSPYLDGGIRLYALQALSGKTVIQRRVNAGGPESFQASKPKDPAAPADRTPPMLPDILSTSGDLVYMRWMGFDTEGRISLAVEPHLFSATGFLDDTWWHRTYWQYGTWMRGGFGGWPQAARQVPAGRLMAVADDALFGFGRSKYDVGNPKDVHAGHVGVVKDGYQDSGRIDHARNPYRLFSMPRTTVRKGTGKARRGDATGKCNWQVPVPMLARAMVLADRTLFIAGPHAGKDNRGLTELDAVRPGLLWAVSAPDGTKLGDCELPAAPVLDGMAATPGRLVVSCVDGSVCCLASAATERLR
ncbi:MAG: PQQ-binding-like beta-propeller repeat protein [Phycisphaerae bacterium]